MADLLTQRDLVNEGLAVLRTELDPEGTNPPDTAPGSELTTFVSVAAGMITPLLGHVADRVAARTLSGASSIADVQTLAQDTYHDDLKEAAAAGGYVYLKRGGSTATRIPKGSRFAVPSSGTQSAVYFEADDDVPSAATKVAIPVTCTEVGRKGNVDVSDITKIVDALPDTTWALFVPTGGDAGPAGETAPADFGGGSDPETIDEAKARLAKVPSDASQKPGLLEGILFGVWRVPGVADVVAVEPGDGTGVLYVGDAQYALPDKLRTAVEAAAKAWRCFGCPVRVRPFTVQTVTNTLVIYMQRELAAYDISALLVKARAAVLDYYLPGRPHPDEYVRSALGNKVAKAVGVDDVQSVLVSAPGSDQLRAAAATYGSATTINRYLTDVAHVNITFAPPQTLEEAHVADPTYPATRLRVGKRDPAFGGAAADDFGGPAWAFHDNAIQEMERQMLQALWSAASVTRARVASAGVPGDFVLFIDSGAADLYTLKTVAALVAGGGTYDGAATPRYGMLLEPCSAYAAAGDEPLIALFGVIPSSIHGLNPGTAGYAVMNTTTGRLALGDGTPGEVVVGRLSTSGALYLAAWNPSSP